MKLTSAVKALMLLILSSPYMTSEAAARERGGASDKLVPQWVHKQPVARNAGIEYVLVPLSTSGSTVLSGNSPAALNELVRYLPRDWNISSTESMSSVMHSREGGSGSQFEREDIVTVDVVAQGSPMELSCKLVDSYWERKADGTVQNYWLYQVASPDSPARFEETSVTTAYGARGLWRSAIIPGWGQFHKGSYLKGGLILGGCAVMAGGIAAVESIRQDYVRRVGETHNADLRRSYAYKADQLATVRNVCIGVAGALYLYNLIDAIAAPGAKRIKVYPTSPDGASLAMALNLTF